MQKAICNCTTEFSSDIKTTLQWRWVFTGPYSTVDSKTHKVFMIKDIEQTTLAQDICDTDYSRKCIGISLNVLWTLKFDILYL